MHLMCYTGSICKRSFIFPPAFPLESREAAALGVLEVRHRFQRFRIVPSLPCELQIVLF